MKSLRIGFLLSVLLLSSSLWSQGNNTSMSPELQKLYRTLSLGDNYEQKKAAVLRMQKMYEESPDMILIDTAIDLLNHSYDFVDFNEQDQVLYYNDKIAKELVVLVSKSRHPKAFVALLEIVTKRKHTDDTIREAWKAIKNLDWKLSK